MKIKRPLINQFYEEDAKDQEPTQMPLERPAFALTKPLEQPKAETPSIKEESPEEPEKEVVIQTKPSEEFLRWKAQQEIEAKNKAVEAEKLKVLQEERIKMAEEEKEAQKRKALEIAEIERLQQEQKRREHVEQAIEQPLPKTAVRAEEMPQKPKIIKKPEVIVRAEDQLEFGITPKNITFEQRIQYLKMYFERRQELLEISMLWKNPSLPFNIISVIFVIGLLFIGGIFEFDKIPLKIPLFYNHVEKSWEQTDKSTVFIMGIILLITEGFLINLIIKIFKSDRRLALTLSWVITFINVLIIIAALQIYSLIT